MAAWEGRGAAQRWRRQGGMRARQTLRNLTVPQVLKAGNLGHKMAVRPRMAPPRPERKAEAGRSKTGHSFLQPMTRFSASSFMASAR